MEIPLLPFVIGAIVLTFALAVLGWWLALPAESWRMFSLLRHARLARVDLPRVEIENARTPFGRVHPRQAGPIQSARQQAEIPAALDISVTLSLR